MDSIFTIGVTNIGCGEGKCLPQMIPLNPVLAKLSWLHLCETNNVGALTPDESVFLTEMRRLSDGPIADFIHVLDDLDAFSELYAVVQLSEGVSLPITNYLYRDFSFDESALLKVVEPHSHHGYLTAIAKGARMSYEAFKAEKDRNLLEQMKKPYVNLMASRHEVLNTFETYYLRKVTNSIVLDHAAGAEIAKFTAFLYANERDLRRCSAGLRVPFGLFRAIIATGKTNMILEAVCASLNGYLHNKYPLGLSSAEAMEIGRNLISSLPSISFVCPIAHGYVSSGGKDCAIDIWNLILNGIDIDCKSLIPSIQSFFPFEVESSELTNEGVLKVKNRDAVFFVSVHPTLDSLIASSLSSNTEDIQYIHCLRKGKSYIRVSRVESPEIFQNLSRPVSTGTSFHIQRIQIRKRFKQVILNALDCILGRVLYKQTFEDGQLTLKYPHLIYLDELMTSHKEFIYLREAIRATATDPMISRLGEIFSIPDIDVNLSSVLCTLHMNFSTAQR